VRGSNAKGTRIGPAVAIALAACAVIAASCGPVRVGYLLPDGALVPAGWRAPVDQRELFAERFCAAVPTSYGRCDRWLNLPPTLDPNQVGSWASLGPDPDTSYLIVAVGGIFSDCLNGVVTTLKDALDHLRTLHFKTDYWPTCADCSTAENGARLLERLRQLPAGIKVIAVGHSKGAVDLIDAVSQDPSIGDVLKAVITINSPVSGTRLADLIPKALDDLSKKIGKIGACTLGSGKGLDSLTRRDRQLFWTKNPTLWSRTRFLSLVSVSDRDHTSPVFHVLWDPMSRYSLDQDSQVIAEEGIVPGGSYLGRLVADHWASAFPIELVKSPVVDALFKGQNHFPRGAMLEAAVRVTIEGLLTH
jgi:hypothetical protein